MDDGIIIDPEFKALIPPASAEELAQLEANLLETGHCRDDLVTWLVTNTLLDGHQRYALCKKHGLRFNVVTVDLPDRNAAIAWIIRNQFGRRNMVPFVRAELAGKLETIIAADARKRMERGTTDPVTNLSQGKTRAKVASAADVSEGTIAKVKAIAATAAEVVKDMARAGDISVDAAAKVSTLPKAEQEAIAAEGPKAVKDRAAKLRKDRKQKPDPAPEVEPDPEDAPMTTPEEQAEADALPWAKLAAGVASVQATLRATARQLFDLLDCDAATKQLRNPHAKGYSHSGTIGAIYQIVRVLDGGMPARLDDTIGGPGYLTVDQAKARDARKAA